MSSNFKRQTSHASPSNVPSPSNVERPTSNVSPSPSNVKRQTSNSLKVLAAIPCYNTAKTIAKVVAKTKKYVDEVIVIDDGSTDMTAEVARAAGAVVISHERNRGKGAAMKTAMANTDGDILIFIDGDGQHDPDDIPNLLKPILQGKADFVIGSRYLSRSKKSSNPFIRKISNAIASLVISVVISVFQPIARFITRQPLSKRNTQAPEKSESIDVEYRILDGKFKWITDCTSGLTAMRKDTCGKLALVSDRFQIETEMIFEQAKNGFIIAETPVSCTWDGSLSGLSVTKDGLSTLWLLFKKLTNYSGHNKAQIMVKLSVALASIVGIIILICILSFIDL